jgi:PIN domain nuclease of toxin-antitoxin system
MERRYLIDTCTFIWYISGNKRVKKFIEDIESSNGNFAISVESLKELAFLLQSGKIKMDFDFKKLIKLLQERKITIQSFSEYELECLFKLPFFKDHADPVDRQIIATAIANHRTLISGDKMFPQYSKCGLHFISI